jgi:ketosteroid isomerase-like protein
MNLKSIVESANVEWNKALNGGNIKTLASLYTENATISAGDGTTIAGRQEIEALFNGFVKNGVHNHTLEIVEVDGSDKIIYQVSKWHANGAESSSFGGITMSVLEQSSNGKWHTCSHVWNMKA